MPVWGPIFRGLDPDDRLNRIRNRNVASIQRKSAAVPGFRQDQPGIGRHRHASSTSRLVSRLRQWLDAGGFMPGMSTIHEFLREAHVPYSVVPHRPAFTAQDEAAATHVPGRDWAKVVVCFIDGEPVEAVVTAPSVVNLPRLLELAGGSEIRLAKEEELRRLYPGCEVGAMPPFGPLYGQTVFVDAALALEPDIVFNAGTHRDAIVMHWNDFVKMVNPIVGRFGA
jgi:Ala-tRNA(Pro) deacylase